MAASNPVIGEARGRGAMVAIELVGPDGITPDKAATARVAAACHAQGVLVLTAGTYGNVLRLLPPLVIPDDLLDRRARHPRIGVVGGLRSLAQESSEDITCLMRV